jgi:MoaA/NifB/PqqE/SkfB family radical SAM enzyme
MLDLRAEAKDVGFDGIGITGGEPFLVPDMPELLRELSQVLPVLVLTNGTLFARALLDRMEVLRDADVTLQISLDHADPEANDVMRGPENFRKVVEAVPELLRRGIAVRIATTLERRTPTTCSGSASCTGASASATTTTWCGRSSGAAARHRAAGRRSPGTWTSSRS